MAADHPERAGARQLERELAVAGRWDEYEALAGECRHGCNGSHVVLGYASEICDWRCHAGLEAAHPCEGCGHSTMNWMNGWFCGRECVRDYLDELVAGWAAA